MAHISSQYKQNNVLLNHSTFGGDSHYLPKKQQIMKMKFLKSCSDFMFYHPRSFTLIVKFETIFIFVFKATNQDSFT